MKKTNLLFALLIIASISGCELPRGVLKNTEIKKDKNGFLCGTYSRDYTKLIGDPFVMLFVQRKSDGKKIKLRLEMPEKEKGVFIFKLPAGDYQLNSLSALIETEDFVKYTNVEFSINESTASYIGFFQFSHSSIPARFSSKVKNLYEADKKLLLQKYTALNDIKIETIQMKKIEAKK